MVLLCIDRGRFARDSGRCETGVGGGIIKRTVG